MSRRPGLRTRVYASNLGMVENNYKEALARLERSRRPASADREQQTRLSPLPISKPLYDFNGDEFDEDLQLARSRASKVIHQKSSIDSCSDKLRSVSLAPAPALLDSEFDDQVSRFRRRFLLRRSDVNRDNSVIYVIPLPSDSHYFPRSYFDYYNDYYNWLSYGTKTGGCGCGC